MHYQPLDVSSLHLITPVLLKQGTRLLEPDVYRTHLNGQPAVVKDYGRYRRTLLAPIARLMVRHEASMLRQLQGWRHAPALPCSARWAGWRWAWNSFQATRSAPAPSWARRSSSNCSRRYAGCMRSASPITICMAPMWWSVRECRC